MQVAALLEEAPPAARRSLARKWSQMQRAWAFERHWHKDEILEAYLNLASFRGEVTGLGAASRVLLHKSTDNLDSAEALLLSLLLRSPNATRAALIKRGCQLTTRLTLGTDCPALTREIAATFSPAEPAATTTPQLAPHVAQRLLANNLREVRSTLNADIQRAARHALQRQLVALRGRQVTDGAVLVLDNASGEVLAYVGNGGATSSARYVDGVQARRQAGSTLKPFLYQLALEQRILTAASLLEDTPVNLETPRGLYVPQNYDREFKGLVSVRSSLAGSLNIPAVRTLMLLGPDTFLARLRRLGFNGITEEADFYGYALALGATEVSLWELTNAYRSLALGSLHPTPLRLTLDDCGTAACTPATARTLDSADANSANVRAAAFIVSDILADRGSRSSTFGLENPLATAFWSAVKTGTSKHMRDNWCVGYSTRYTVGVWVGNFDGSPMQDVSGLTGAAPVWAELMHALHDVEPQSPPLPPPDLARAAVKFAQAVEADREEWFIAGTENSSVAPGAAKRTPRIVYPGPHSILVLDPDIPAPHQRVFFEMQPPQTGLTWQLNNVPFASEESLAWAPTRGEFTLRLLDTRARVLDEVHFTVRGYAAQAHQVATQATSKNESHAD
jgi:penicillin-binding protein 1C